MQARRDSDSAGKLDSSPGECMSRGRREDTAMFMRYLKAQGLVLLCGGLVGPIFLGTFFAFGREPILKWMFWVGLFITAADVLIALALTNYGAKSAVRAQFLEHQGVLALAQVTAISETGTRINDQPLVKINLHIEGPGLAPIDGQDRVIASVTRLPVITGRKLVVLVDPTSGKYQIDWERSALVNGVVPAQFSLDEDGRTYDLSGQAGPLMEIMQILKANNIPMHGTIDIRSNPAVRQQVMEVVRRAAAPPSAPASAPQAMPAVLTPPAPSTAQRLQELETLRATGSISEAEYTAKRQQIIAAL
jgi:hypothetical protein